MTPEELLNKINTLEWLLQHKVKEEIPDNNDYSIRRHKRLQQYKLNLIRQFKVEVCKKQRKNCYYAVMHLNDGQQAINGSIQEHKNLILNAPEP